MDSPNPYTNSVNDGISKVLCGFSCVMSEGAIHRIIQLWLAKLDIKSIFPVDRHLPGMDWHNSIYPDTCVPFGLRSAPKLQHTG